MWTYGATLVRAIDGDTYVFDIDLGFYITTRQHVRLAGIDCPEIGTPEGKAALLAARTWFQSCGDRAVLTTTKAQTKTFDRWVAKVSSPFTVGGWVGDLEEYLRGLGHFKPVEQLGK